MGQILLKFHKNNVSLYDIMAVKDQWTTTSPFFSRAANATRNAS